MKASFGLLTSPRGITAARPPFFILRFGARLLGSIDFGDLSIFGAFWGLLGRSWVALRPLDRLLEPLGVLLGPPGTLFGASWGAFGGLLGPLGRLWGQLGGDQNMTKTTR